MTEAESRMGFDEELLAKMAWIGRNTPKQKDEILFVGRVGGQFMDNVKYAFLDCVRHYPQLKARFLTLDRKVHDQLHAHGLPVLMFPRGDALEQCASAGVVICDDFWWRDEPSINSLLQGALIFQLWHGIPLKSIGFVEIASSVNMTPDKAKRLLGNYSGYGAVLSTSPEMTQLAFARAFGADDFPELGYPRNDAMLRPLDRYDMINSDVELLGELVTLRKQGWRVVFYLPTFRDGGGDPFSDRALTPSLLQRFTENEKVVLVCKLHPYVQTSIQSNLKNVRLCRPTTDPYPLLRQADVLLTDYSSIYFDYLMLDRPVVYYQYDLDRYLSRDREMMLDMEAFTAGARPRTEEDLYSALAQALNAEDEFARQRKALARRCFVHFDALAGRRVVEYVAGKMRLPAESRMESFRTTTGE